MKKILLRTINLVGAALPKSLQRFIVDFPGVLGLLQRLGHNAGDEVVSPEGFRLSINPLFHSNLVQRGGLADYEPEMRAAIRLVTRPGWCAYDVGANVGVFSFLFASLVGESGKVYAFEPEPNNYECLALSVSQNSATNIITDNRALGAISQKELFDRRGGAFSGRLVGTEGTHTPTGNVIQVETTSIDSLIENEGYQAPDVLKIDVEGNEGLVLEGMQTTLELHSPVIICELHSHLGDSVEDVHQLLRSHNYIAYSISDYLRNERAAKALASLGGVRHIVAVKSAT
jgi:FkbM family methyltransferase